MLDNLVSTLAVEWIEISLFYNIWIPILVSTLAVEWIEIDIHDMTMDQFRGLHPRGGVD